MRDLDSLIIAVLHAFSLLKVKTDLDVADALVEAAWQRHDFILSFDFVVQCLVVLLSLLHVKVRLEVEDLAPLVEELVVLNQLWNNLNWVLLVLEDDPLLVFVVCSTELVSWVLDACHDVLSFIFFY